MVVTPNQLADANNPVYLNEISQLEAQIDAWLNQWYTDRYNSIPLLLVQEPRKIVQASLIKIYKAAGWTLSFEVTEDKGNVGILIKEDIWNEVV